MQEAEVSLRVALYYIKNRLTDQDVSVSIDGAHIKTGDRIHFDIWRFLGDQGCSRIEGGPGRWQGRYQVSGHAGQIIISSRPGIGDVNIRRSDGKKLYVESKKGKENKSGHEYPLMREAIRQLMTSSVLTDDVIPAVAVPYSEKSLELAGRWSKYPQMQQVGIRFLLVRADGEIVMI